MSNGFSRRCWISEQGHGPQKTSSGAVKGLSSDILFIGDLNHEVLSAAL